MLALASAGLHICVRKPAALDEIRVPTLVVHHENDRCAVTPYADAQALLRQLKQTPKKEFMAFRGGSSAGDPCEGFAAARLHGHRRRGRDRDRRLDQSGALRRLRCGDTVKVGMRPRVPSE
jgi:hypothetical protein